MVTVDPSAAESRPKYMVIASDNWPGPIGSRACAFAFAGGEAIAMRGGEDDDV
jgi:hypothetical protein